MVDRNNIVNEAGLKWAATLMTAYFEREKEKMVTLSVNRPKREGRRAAALPAAMKLDRRRILWSWREELNLQPAVYKTAALPLSYASHRKVP